MKYPAYLFWYGSGVFRPMVHIVFLITTTRPESTNEHRLLSCFVCWVKIIFLLLPSPIIGSVSSHLVPFGIKILKLLLGFSSTFVTLKPLDPSHAKLFCTHTMPRRGRGGGGCDNPPLFSKARYPGNLKFCMLLEGCL